MAADVPAILYSVIDGIGRDRIRRDITSDIGKSVAFCNEIMQKCEEELGSDPQQELLATAIEGLLHFMLTAAVLPSQRKTRVGEVELDIVIPSIRALVAAPEKSLVIQVIKTASDYEELSNASKVQPNHDNLWLVSVAKLTTHFKNYSLEDRTLPLIIVDIYEFVRRNGISGLKLVQ
jgi:hypothetical protein